MKIDFPAIQTRLTSEEEQEVFQVIKNSETYSMGPELKQLEKNFSDYIGADHAIGTNSCTSALELAAIVSRVGPGDEVILPAHTFTATALPFMRAGARLVFADIDPKTFLVTAEIIESLITPKTKAIVVVHLYGLMCAMDKITPLAKERGLTLIEDVAQAPGATCHSKKAGSWGDMACFSFHSQKNITALGEGGMFVTSNKELYGEATGLRKIGSQPFEKQEKYWLPAMANIVEAVPGKLPSNFALPEVNAAAANLLLQRIDQINETRRSQVSQVTQALEDYPELEFQMIPDGFESACHLLVARYRSNSSHRDDLIEKLYTDFQIKCVIQYYPLYHYDLFKKNGYGEESCPVSDEFYANMISFPFWSEMPEDKLQYLTQSIRTSIDQLR